MTKHIYIGLDGGGTKTKLIIENENGDLLGKAKAGPSNIRLSVSKAWDSIYHALHIALKQANLSLDDPNYHFHVGMGLAGTEVPHACERFLEKPHPFKTLILRSDAFTACLGAHNDRNDPIQNGSIIIIGTGVIGYCIDQETEFQVNGWGFPHGDEGGGAWLGLEAIRETLQWQDGRAESSGLAQAIFKHFNEDLTALVVWANAANSSNFAEMAPIVIQQLEQKDHSALKLIKKSALEIEKVAIALEKKQITKNPLPCVLFGGMAPFIEPFLSNHLKQHIVKRKNDATVGALMMVKRQVQSLCNP